MSNFDKQLELLIKKAIESNVNYKHAAALIKDRVIYSSGINKFIQSKKNKLNLEYEEIKRTMHAEINVFNNYPIKKGRGMDILVIRINNRRMLKNSRPCNECINRLCKIGIRKVYYSNDNGHIVSEYVQYMDKIHISSGNLIQ